MDVPLCLGAEASHGPRRIMTWGTMFEESSIPSILVLAAPGRPSMQNISSPEMCSSAVHLLYEVMDYPDDLDTTSPAKRDDQLRCEVVLG